MSANTGSSKPKRKRLDDENVFVYLARLERKAVNRLYASCKWSCLGVVRHLSSLSQVIVIRMICVKESKPLSWFEGFVLDNSTSRAMFKDAMQEMHDLKVLVSSGDDDSLKLNSEFRKQIKGSLTDLSDVDTPWQSNETAMAPQVDLDVLDSMALDKWTAILHYIVDSNELGTPKQKILQLLVSMGLMRYGESNSRLGDSSSDEEEVNRKKNQRYLGRPKITKRGYEFMLRDISQQIWMFMLHYTLTEKNPETVLQLLFRMSYCSPGMACAMSSLDQNQRKLLDDFNLFGLVYIETGSDRFYPTSLGVNIVFGQSREERMAAAARVVELPQSGGDPPPSVAATNSKKLKTESKIISSKSKGDGKKNNIFVIVETNFKVYAYTESSLHVEMLKLFVEPECILPNLIVATISRNSIRHAFKMGITADQIIHFLTENAHPLCKERHRLVPDNITDQIILWEGERNRVVAKKACMYDKFPNEFVYSECVRHASRMGWLIFSTQSKDNMFVVVKEDKHKEMKAFIKQVKDKKPPK